MLRMLSVLSIVLFAACAVAQTVVDIEDVPIAADSEWFGPFSSRGAEFSNYYFMDWNYWEGFAASSKTDTAATGLGAQFNAIPGGGASGSMRYAVGYVGWYAAPIMTFAAEVPPAAVSITNINYAYYSMLHGDLFTKKFGGSTGHDPDWFLLTITGKDAGGGITGTVDFYLADFRFDDDGEDYIVNDWNEVDLTALGSVKTLEFALSSTDNDPVFGMNTPAYFALDNLTMVPEPVTMGLLAAGAGVLIRRKRAR